MGQDDKIRKALEKAIKRAEEKLARTSEPSSKADIAIQKLRKDRQLTREELHRPTTI